MCRRNYYYFLKEFIEITIHEEIVWNWHVEYLCQKMQEYGRCVLERKPTPKPYLIINIPPGTTKSTICTQFFPLWLWINDPTIVTIALSYSSGLSLRHAIRSRDVWRSEKFQEYFPNILPKKDQDNKGDFANTFGGQRISTSIGATVLGDHAHIQIIDDPLNVEESVSEVERASTNDFIRHTLPTRKKNKANTPTILIMQRLHQEDPSGMLLDLMGEQVEHICLPAELSSEVKPFALGERYIDGLLDPLRLSREILDQQKKILGGVGYAQQFSQKAVPQEGALIKEKWLNRIAHIDFIKNVRMQGGVFNYYIDTAYTEKQKNDPSVILCTCFFNGNLYVVNVARKWMEFPDLSKYINNFVHENSFEPRTRILIEPKASGISIYQQLKRDTTLNIILAPAPKDDKITRVTAVTPFIESGRIVIVDGIWNDEFINECKMFPNDKHDDQVDTLVMAINEITYKQNRKPIY